jgi:hypothetical protein
VLLSLTVGQRGIVAELGLHAADPAVLVFVNGLTQLNALGAWQPERAHPIQHMTFHQRLNPLVLEHPRG